MSRAGAAVRRRRRERHGPLPRPSTPSAPSATPRRCSTSRWGDGGRPSRWGDGGCRRGPARTPGASGSRTAPGSGCRPGPRATSSVTGPAPAARRSAMAYQVSLSASSPSRRSSISKPASKIARAAAGFPWASSTCARSSRNRPPSPSGPPRSCASSRGGLVGAAGGEQRGDGLPGERAQHRPPDHVRGRVGRRDLGAACRAGERLRDSARRRARVSPASGRRRPGSAAAGRAGVAARARRSQLRTACARSPACHWATPRW